MYEHEIEVHWYSPELQTHGVARERVSGKRPLKSYKLECLNTACGYPADFTARTQARGACDIIRFQDTADVIPSKAWTRIIGRWTPDGDPPMQLPGFDHSELWKSRAARLYLITTEPYNELVDEAAATCEAQGWGYHVFPPGVGFWNPHPDPEKIGTRLLIASPGDIGLPLGMVLPQLQDVLKPWDIESDANT